MTLKGSGSDVTSSFITAAAADPDGISTAASISGAANLTIGGALASGGSVTMDSPRNVTILSAGDDQHCVERKPQVENMNESTHLKS